MPKNIPGIVKRSRRRQAEKVRILVQPNPYPLEQPGVQPNVSSSPINPQMQPDNPGPQPQQMQANNPGPQPQQMQANNPGLMPQQMQANNPGLMPQQMQANNPGLMPQQMQANNPGLMPQQMQANNPGLMPQQMQANNPGPLQKPMQPGGPASLVPVPGQVVPMQSNGQWRADPNAQSMSPFPQANNQAWQGGPGRPGAPNGVPPHAAYNNQPANPGQQPITPPQMQRPSTNPLPNNMPAQPGRHTPPPASNIPVRPGQTPAPQYSPAPLPRNPNASQPGLAPAAGNAPQPTVLPRTPSSNLLGRQGPASLPGSAGAPTPGAPTAHIFVEIDGKIVQEVRLDRPVLSVGRQDGRDIQIKHQSVSRTHARVVAENGAWFVEDAGSVNGIVFNGQRVQRTAVNNGDRVFIAPNISLLYKTM